MPTLEKVQDFMCASQLLAIDAGLRGEERAHFEKKIAEITNTINTMPKTYEQDGKGDQAVAYLHYFKGGCDWYITEKDMGDGSGDTSQYQAFGLADLGWGSELGYISIVELIRNGVELDLYYTPQTIAEIRAKHPED